jgi:hypothetical protein
VLHQFSLAREIGDDRIKLPVGMRAKRLPQALIVFIGEQSPLVGGTPQPRRGPLAIRIRRPLLAALKHLKTVPRQAVRSACL